MNKDSFNTLIKRLKIFQPYPSVYDPIAGMSEFGPYGATIKANLVNRMRAEFRKARFWEVDCPLVSPTIVWKASGHLDRFVDVIAESDGKIYRIEKVLEENYPEIPITEKGLAALSRLIEQKAIVPRGNKEKLHTPREYNLMLTTSVAGTPAVLRPETATTTYLSFQDYLTLFRGQMPLRLFQYGRAFRNEITSRQGLIRGREFEQCEGQIFIIEEQKRNFADFERVRNKQLRFLDSETQRKGIVEPRRLILSDTVERRVLPSQAYAYCFGVVSTILDTAGINPDSVRFRQHLPDEKAHYALDAWDVEVLSPQYGQVEVCGVHDRGDYDLKRHQDFSGRKFTVPDSSGQERIPNILEIAFGVGRTAYCMLEQSFSEREGKTVLRLPKRIAPISVGIFPLVNKGGLEEISANIEGNLNEQEFAVVRDTKGSIGKRYARMDEIGTPYCVTVDFQSKDDGTVTLRDRDTTTQQRVMIGELPNLLYRGLNS